MPAGWQRTACPCVTEPPAAAAAVYPWFMRKLIISLCVVAGIGAGATAVAGCGADDAVGLDVAKAADATAQKGTARIAVNVSVAGAGLPLPVDLSAKGVTALDSSKGRLTFDLKPLLALADAPQGTPGALEVRFDGGSIYAEVPKLDELKVPGGKPWVSLELPKLASALGLPAEGVGKLFTLEPAAQLRALKAAKGVKEVGKEDVGGAETTHYRGTFTLSDFVATLPADERKEVEQAIERIDALGGGSGASLNDPVPADLWVDDDGVTRRLLSTTKLPAQGGQPAGTIKQSYVLSDFGVALDAAPPPASDTFDATGELSRLLGQLATSGGGSATPSPTPTP